jgi:hypothetical protein
VVLGFFLWRRGGLNRIAESCDRHEQLAAAAIYATALLDVDGVAITLSPPAIFRQSCMIDFNPKCHNPFRFNGAL